MVPSEALAGLGGVALFAAPGAGLAEILPAVRELPLGRRLAYAWLLGVAWTAGWLYALSHWLAVPLRTPAILMVAAVPVLAGSVSWLRRRSSLQISPPSRSPGRKRLAVRIALAAGALVSLALLCDALDNPLADWDGRMTWSAQARYVRSEGTVHPAVLAQRGWYVAHPWYPLLMPVAQVAVLEVTRADPDHHAFRPMYAVFFPVWLLLIYGGAEALAGRAAAAWTALCAALLSFPAFAGSGGAASAYSDLPLACFFGAGLLLLLNPRLRLSAGLAAGILLAAAVLTKAEGEILAPAALGLALVYPWIPMRGAAVRWRRLWRHRRRGLAAAVLPAALGLGLLLSWRAGVPESFESFEQATSWSLLWPGLFTRIPRLAWDARAEMVSFLNWGIFWSAAPLVLTAGWRALRRRPAFPLLLAAAVPLGVGWLYATISLKPDFMVKVTWNRFLLQASVPFLVLFALALRDLLRRAQWLPRALRP
ncbi:MAG TPA: hypothetical protein VGS07_33825 [Thermoanaerobaculia bacterium]|jgi:hypothetical protein|nr:hypothetical protein [Thermoanaerobaculia bacterium]